MIRFESNSDSSVSGRWTRCIKIFIIWTLRYSVANEQQIDCGKIEKDHRIACERHTMTLECPYEKPLMKITKAEYGRTFPEDKVCKRPVDMTAAPAVNIICSNNVTRKVSSICGNHRTCFLPVNDSTFKHQCSPECQRRRSTRNVNDRSSCIVRASTSFSTSTLPSVIYSTKFTSIGGPLNTQSQMRISTRTPITINSTPSIELSSTTTILNSIEHPHSTQPTRRKVDKVSVRKVQKKSTSFLAITELFAVYDEAAHEHPAMALMWCFIGILLGLFIITMAFLYVERKRKKRDQQIFRLSQLHSEGSAIQSPTIYPSLQFQESHEVENTHETASKPCGSEYNGHASILKDDNSMFINPLWRDSKICVCVMKAKRK